MGNSGDIHNAANGVKLPSERARKRVRKYRGAERGIVSGRK